MNVYYLKIPDDLVYWTGYVAECQLPSLEFATKVHVREQSAFPVVIFYLDNVVHYEPSPNVKISDCNNT